MKKRVTHTILEIFFCVPSVTAMYMSKLFKIFKSYSDFSTAYRTDDIYSNRITLVFLKLFFVFYTLTVNNVFTMYQYYLIKAI